VPDTPEGVSNREEVRRLAEESIAPGGAVGWFEELYRRADGQWDRIPWADLCANPYLLQWLRGQPTAALRGTALVVGCGVGDDAEALAAAGFAVTAFDVSATAIAGCRARFPESHVEYVVADVLAPPPAWAARFDLVFESYTLQVLPPEARVVTIEKLARLLAPGGRVLVLCRGRDRTDPAGQLPWPLTRAELGLFAAHGLRERSFDDFLDHEDPPVRRFRALYERDTPAR
jgi:SAM-dependent methyltransferase